MPLWLATQARSTSREAGASSWWADLKALKASNSAVLLVSTADAIPVLQRLRLGGGWVGWRRRIRRCRLPGRFFGLSVAVRSVTIRSAVLQPSSPGDFLVVQAIAELLAELAEAALQAVGDRAGDGHIQGFGCVASEDAAPGVGVAVGFAIQLDRDPAGDVDDAGDLGGWLAIFAQHRHLLLEALVVKSDHLIPAHDVRLAEQVERPAEQEQVVGGFDHIVAFQVGDCPLPGSLAALDAVHIQRLLQPPKDLFSWTGSSVGGSGVGMDCVHLFLRVSG